MSEDKFLALETRCDGCIAPLGVTLGTHSEIKVVNRLNAIFSGFDFGKQGYFDPMLEFKDKVIEEVASGGDGEQVLSETVELVREIACPVDNELATKVSDVLEQNVLEYADIGVEASLSLTACGICRFMSYSRLNLRDTGVSVE